MQLKYFAYVTHILCVGTLVPSKIIVHPQSQLAHEGSTVNLSCEAAGSDPIRYQWIRINGEISSDRAEGVNTSTLTISPVQQ